METTTTTTMTRSAKPYRGKKRVSEGSEWIPDPKTGYLRRRAPPKPYPPRPPVRTGFEFHTLVYERPNRKLLLNELVGINFVCTFFVGTPVYVPALSQNNPFSNAFTNSFSARIIRLQRPAATCLVFPGGRVLVLGARYERQGLWAAWKCCEILRRCGCRQTTVLDFKVRNIAFTVGCGPAMDLAAFRNDYQIQVEYKPDQFCGATYYPREDESWTFNLYTSGKMVLTGVKSVKKGVKIYNGQLPNFKRYVTATRPVVIRNKMVRNVTKRPAFDPAKGLSYAGYLSTLESNTEEDDVRDDEEICIPEYMQDTAAVIAGLKMRKKRRKPKRRAMKFNRQLSSPSTTTTTTTASVPPARRTGDDDDDDDDE